MKNRITSGSVQREEFLAGIRAELPIILGVFPFGMIFGAIAVDAGMPALVAQSMSAIIFAGSAQFVAAQLMALNTPLAVLLATTFIMNLRHLLYGASLAPHVRHLPLRWRMMLAYLLTDEAYAVTIIHYSDNGRPRDSKHWFFLGAGLMLWTAWQSSTALGIILGARIPENWSLDFTLAVTFIALGVPTLRDRPHLAAAISAGLVAILSAYWPYKLGLMASAVVGILVGFSLERLGNRQKHQHHTQDEDGS
jgi:4-azaleucine resistance transporter AzlC